MPLCRGAIALGAVSGHSLPNSQAVPSISPSNRDDNQAGQKASNQLAVRLENAGVGTHLMRLPDRQVATATS